LPSNEDLHFVEELLESLGISSEENPVLKVLGGGVSNLVVHVETQSGESFVVKTSLPRLRVEEDWFADRERIFREASCLRIIAEYVGQEFAPKVLGEDRAHYACLLECAPEGTVTWKKELLEGRVDPAITEKVAFFLSQFHGKTRDVEAVRSNFSDPANFVQLRINPYLVRTSERHPDLKEPLEEIISNLLSKKLCLVHGDFSPKNILLLPDGRVWIIDCEVAHYGNPAFDVAFCTNHLILKALHLSSSRHLDAARNFWRSYWQDAGWSQQEEFTVRVLGALMLARVDGKSPAEYLSEKDRITVRELSRILVSDRVDHFDKLALMVEEKIPS
jgi:5-methylthioribose kinase